MSVTLGILGLTSRITVTVPSIHLDSDPIKAMHSARKRFAGQGAERVTLVPHRGKHGKGWAVKKEA